jgi:hypothetical protein
MRFNMVAAAVDGYGSVLTSVEYHLSAPRGDRGPEVQLFTATSDVSWALNLYRVHETFSS